ncbi:RNA N(6)-adenosine-methyltransferase METTL16 [Arvicanthis niloticus]|uniref:RNA N(6)-adenosine-methyltransferase METTL16 n=1 Tax=Arvicanthis niloticus TaxID=61156 RepID=UPI001486DB0C|nr:RNA N6-adenosine-methyltransferase METTL16 [Arvicanthis niloticus]XP_034363225.1 RNA N6-adenosine-methyltransferase METTL16 [Arvicanthis niloticus]XP_034363226.1 RNA N6-adenosine-methyltransferase METTL16 [Arvicanthis niloticus]XP_034363227.1 RNA N6-adenosine-methyltransferase METTL16 [Arvicanthis niloticus]
MALSKSMHARNRYKDKPPDFAYLASKYPDFKQHIQINLNGRVSLNFKDPEAVRALTCTLLREDFGLSIDIPLERLIPTVPLRLNYIHWVEDLIGHQDSDKTTLRRGIDIGTGASCIYPLLGATLNGWYFLATEVDDMCFNYAKKNVEQNNLSDLIKVVKVPQKTLLMDALKEESEIVYDFCMCNPPFFANQLEAKGVNSRNSRRPPPSSVNTGGITEIMAEGGELEFVKRIIHDSLQLKKRLRWYSCMLGKKCSLAPLKEELRIQGVPKVTFTEFCQGRTMRWALAWSFYDDVTVPSPPSKRRKLEKPRKPITFVVLESVMKELSLKASSLGSETAEGIVVVTTWIEKILTDLKVQHKRIPCGREEVSLFLTAIENSWIHLRRKRRERVRQLREVPRAPEDVILALEERKSTPKELSSGQDVAHCPQESALCGPDVPEAESAAVGGHCLSQKLLCQEETPEAMEDERDEERGGMEVMESCKGSSDGAQDGEASEKGDHLDGAAGRYLFKCLINIKKEVDDALVEMHWVEGQNRDLMNQLCTYIRNQILRLVAS